MEKINVVVMAGDSKRIVLDQTEMNKSLISIGGKAMVEYVIDALKGSSSIGSIAVVGPIHELQLILGNKVDCYLQEKGSLFDNIKLGIDHFINDRYLLVLSSDIPMMTPNIIESFINECTYKEVDICYPIVEKAIMEQRFPNIDRTYVRLKEGTFTGGNIFYFNPRAIKTCEEFVRKVLEYRKNPIKISKLLGGRFVLKFASGSLSIPDIENQFTNLLKIKGKAIISPYAELANDIDKVSDLQVAESYLK